MNRSSVRLLALVPVVVLTFTARFACAADAGPTLEELQRQLTQQQAQIDALAAQLDDAAAPSRTTLGGYGELHYANLDSGTAIDFHRFVLLVGHEFSDSIRLYSELELEHAVASATDAGEVELEQGFIEFDLPSQTKLKAGLFLLPIGLLNETHEPTTFYGVERNPIETNIIPTTWREAGALVSAPIGDSRFSYDLGVHSGFLLDATYDVREGHQEAMDAVADDLATTARLRWQGDAGLAFGISIYAQSDMAQGTLPGVGGGTLYEAHATYERGPFALRALGARWDIAGSAVAAAGMDVQQGYYAEGAWKANPAFGLFLRYSDWDNGGIGSTAADQLDAGFNWWPHPDVVLKFDVQDQGGSAADDGFSLGLGFRF